MMQHFTIHLNNLLFFSFHGIHEEEKIIGSNYEVELSVTAEKVKDIVTIDDTIDYTKLLEIVTNRMNVPTPLLETVAENICNDIMQIVAQPSEISITIKKLNPPVTMQGNVGITLKKSF